MTANWHSRKKLLTPHHAKLCQGSVYEHIPWHCILRSGTNLSRWVLPFSVSEMRETRLVVYQITESLTGRRVLNFPRSALNCITHNIMKVVIKAHSRCSWKWYRNIRAWYGIVSISAECTGDYARIEGDLCVYNRDESPSSFYCFPVSTAQTSIVNSNTQSARQKFIFIHHPLYH